MTPGSSDNNYIDVQIPDRQQESGPFVPAAATHAIVTMHGTWTLPWQVLRHFLNAVTTSGDIVEDHPAPTSATPYEHRNP